MDKNYNNSAGDSIRQYSYCLSRIINVAVTLVFMMLLVHPQLTWAVNPVDKLSEIQKKLSERLKDVSRTREKEKSLGERINDIDRIISLRESELKSYDKKIKETRSDIRNVTDEINRMKGNLTNNIATLKEYVLAIYKRHRSGETILISSARDNQDFLRKSRYIQILASHESQMINRFRDELYAIEEKKKRLEQLNESLKESKRVVKLKQEELKSDRSKKDRLLAELKAKRMAHEKKIADLKKSSRKLEEMVHMLHAKAIPTAILGSGFRALKGSLPWPVNGDILAKYGSNIVKEFNIKVFKEGIEISARDGHIAKAVAGGRVVYAGKFRDYGNLIIIDHGNNYHSLYGNLDNMIAKKGELIAEGMEVGSVRESKQYSEPALYFEIRYKGKPLDPVKWLKPVSGGRQNLVYN